MAFVDLDEVKPGMVLKSDVATSKGHLLLIAGTELSTKHLRILKGRDITIVDIIGADDLYDTEDTTVAQILPIEATAPITELFANTDTAHPFMKELMRLCKKRAQENQPRHGNHGG